MQMYSSLTHVYYRTTIWKFKVHGVTPKKQFSHHEPFLNHYSYHNKINYHNNYHNFPILIEDTRGTKYCHEYAHELLIVVMYVNESKSAQHCHKDKVSIPGLEFCQKIVFKLIHNTIYQCYCRDKIVSQGDPP